MQFSACKAAVVLFFLSLVLAIPPKPLSEFNQISKITPEEVVMGNTQVDEGADLVVENVDMKLYNNFDNKGFFHMKNNMNVTDSTREIGLRSYGDEFLNVGSFWLNYLSAKSFPAMIIQANERFENSGDMFFGVPLKESRKLSLKVQSKK